MGNVLWIGGAPGAGKTTVATRLAKRHGLRLYNADTRTWAHVDRAVAAGSPAGHAWHTLPPAERWRGTAAELVELSLHAERGPMVSDDLRALPPSPLVVAEGTTLPAADADPARSLWLIPTPAFAEAQVDRRGGPPPVRRLHLALVTAIEREAREHGVPVLSVDGSLTGDETVAAVAERFADAIAEGPRAESRAERLGLLREANLAHVEQVRGYFARPWAEGDAETVERAFVCECGDTHCIADVVATVAAAAAAPVVAPGHGA